MRNTDEVAALAAVDDLATACANVLGECLVSAIVHGSLTQDDFRAGKSDLDLLLVVERALTRDQADGLITVVQSTDLGPAAGVDLLVVTRHAAAVRSAQAPARELLVGRWLSPDDEMEVERADEHASDNWPELSEARANGRSLIGPEPQEVIGQVPPERVRANSLGHLRRWLGLIGDTRNAVFMVVTACRMWRFALMGDHVSKTAAARWALEHDPALTAVESALSALTTSQVVTIAPAEVESVLLRVLRDLDSGTGSK
ncbi:aminoglycoside adenylyltransferase domain-containing protein [Nocardioides sp. GXQ0305]|uniref:aminoglycoside adenylyltransferase domain-containing protein n=1 Tax=Nocardioides sp. GXQ0305 TaxID=3423912 RepID=UPI003D7DBF58